MFDLKCTECSWRYDFHFKFLHLMHMCLINDAVYQERAGSHLANK